MRNFYYTLIALVGLALFSCGPTYVVQDPNPAPPPQPQQAAPAEPEATYQNFYDALSPYGEWIDNPEYGYVWMPNVGPEFRPYATNGNWVYTEEGWAWNSDYSWGWAPFHYGRWFFQDGYGWMWIPGNEWAPAWVTWRRSPEYYGWAPLGPSVSISVAVNGGYNPPPHYWNFVPQQYVAREHVNNYVLNEQQNTTIVNNTTVIHNTTVVNNTYNNTTVINNNVNNRVTVNNYAGGPDPNEVSRVSGTQLRPVAVRESNTPQANRTSSMFAVFRPRINTAPQNTNAARPAPPRVQQLNNVRPVNPRIYNNNRGVFNTPGNNNTNINNTNINNTNVNNTNINNNNTTNNNTYNNFRNNQNQGNATQPGNQPGNQPVNQGQFGVPPANQGQFNRPGNQPGNNTRYIPGANTNNGNPAMTNPAVTPTPTQTVPGVMPGGNPAPVNNRLPANGTDNGNGNGYRNNGNGNVNGNGNRNNGNGNSNGFRNNGTANNGNPGAGNGNGNNGNGRGNGNAGNANGNARPGQPGTPPNQPRPFLRPMPKPKDTPKPANPNH